MNDIKDIQQVIEQLPFAGVYRLATPAKGWNTELTKIDPKVSEDQSPMLVAWDLRFWPKEENVRLIKPDECVNTIANMSAHAFETTIADNSVIGDLLRLAGSKDPRAPNDMTWFQKHVAGLALLTSKAINSQDKPILWETPGFFVDLSGVSHESAIEALTELKARVNRSRRLPLNGFVPGSEVHKALNGYAAWCARKEHRAVTYGDW